MNNQAILLLLLHTFKILNFLNKLLASIHLLTIIPGVSDLARQPDFEEVEGECLQIHLGI